jgi:hypothetical protein
MLMLMLETAYVLVADLLVAYDLVFICHGSNQFPYY